MTTRTKRTLRVRTQVSSKVEMIGPRKASQYLKLNTSNRPMSERAILKYLAAIESGEWELNGETIKFGKDDRKEVLIDGQQRLTAIVRSGKQVPTIVVRGLNPKAFDSIDQGKSRTLSDVFARHGEKRFAMLSGAVSWIWRFAKRRKRDVLNTSTAPSHNVSLEILEANPGLRKFVTKCKTVPWISASLVSAVAYYGSREIRDQAKGFEFMEKLLEGTNLSKRCPLRNLREYLIGIKMSDSKKKSKVTRETQAALLVIAWNNWVSNTTSGRPRWRPSNDNPFPIFKKGRTVSAK